MTSLDASRRAAIGGILLAATLASCASDPTEILIVVSSDLAVPAELDELAITVHHPDGVQMRSSRAPLDAGAGGLPRTLGMVHTGGPLGPYRATVVGLRAGTPVAERIGELHFVPGAVRAWRVVLDRACVGMDCGSQTCADGRCRSVSVAPGELEGWPLAMDPDAGRPPCEPRPEVCDGLDDDCDGQADEGFDLRSDPRHCGGCGVTCALPMASASCVRGACAVATCEAGFGDCNGAAADGCETELSSLDHCGACGDRCAFANADAACADGECVLGPCADGFGDCNASPGDGCEAPLTTAAACGACDTPCVTPNGVPACVDGASCAITSCDGAFRDCNGMAGDGCEVDTDRDDAHCGACGTVCSAGDTCQGGACCAPGCPRCAQSCVDGTSCGCDAGCGCTLDCSSRSCDLDCRDPGTVCQIDATGASSVSGTCAAGASCTMDASGAGNLAYTCAGSGTSCDVDCTSASRCHVTCTAGAACAVDCAGASNCQIRMCSLPPVTCPGTDTLVCGRGCP